MTHHLIITESYRFLDKILPYRFGITNVSIMNLIQACTLYFHNTFLFSTMAALSSIFLTELASVEQLPPLIMYSNLHHTYT